VLNRSDVAHLRVRVVFAELATGSALAQQIPALVEGLLDMSDPLHIELVGGAENVFFVDECSDPIEHFLVSHAVLLHWRAPPTLCRGARDAQDRFACAPHGETLVLGAADANLG
jgi:hypothetical protein